MQGKSSDAPQQWSVHAHFTISHPGMDDPNATQQTYADRDENGVHMSYSWKSQSNDGQDAAPIPNVPDNKSSSYGFQKGNLLFTSIPPPRRTFSTNPSGNLLHIARPLGDSGYNSSLVSPNSCISSAQKRTALCNQKCKSTCSIMLSTTIDEQPEFEDSPDSVSQLQCGRTHSLRCQTPSVRSDKSAPFYGCGDPWCHHSLNDSGPFSPTQGSETSCSTGQTAFYRPTLDLRKCTVEDRCKDAAVQTFEMVDKCTSPFTMVDSFYLKNNKDEDLKKDKTKKRFYSNRSTTEPIVTRTHSRSTFSPDSLDSYKPKKRLVRQPAKLYDKSPIISNTKSSLTESKSSDSTKKPRTVHIDVYCTGTEQESESTSDVDSKSGSTPQTVFESEKVKITHSRSHDNNLPIKLKELSAEDSLKLLDRKRDNESDDDISTAYPSKLSSYSAFGGLSSFASSVPPSWSTYSVSADNDYDSMGNTSWKDTFSDFESVNRSRSSIAYTDSLDFVPKLLTQKSDSLGERQEVDDVKKTTASSAASLNPSDSFEYANSDDKLRIKHMEHTWSEPNKQWKSPQLERKHLLQQQKLKEYVEKRFKDNNVGVPKTQSKDSDSESDSSIKGWSFVKHSKDEDKEKTLENKLSVPVVFESKRSATLRSPSILALQEKLTINPTLRSPFMIVPGIFTDQRLVAKKFGTVVEVYKKPGHHIGPAKNPECQCDHCRNFFEHVGRGRARSLGETFKSPWSNWRKSSKFSQLKDD